MRIATVLLAWLSMLAVDLVLHAGLLAGFYVEGSGFLLAPADAFVRIPAGYAAFLGLAVALVWLMGRLGTVGLLPGARLGLALGAIAWGSLVLGLWSITTASPGLLAGWWIGQSLELGVGGGVAGSLAAGASRRRVSAAVIGMLAAALAIVVILQSTGLAPAVRFES